MATTTLSVRPQQHADEQDRIVERVLIEGTGEDQDTTGGVLVVCDEDVEFDGNAELEGCRP